jgi:hypothetical protein
MIEEDTLADLLAEHALRIPVPAAGVDALLVRAPEVERRALARRMPRPSARVLAGAAALCLAAGGCVALVRSGGGASSSGSTAAGGIAGLATSSPPTSAVGLHGAALPSQRGVDRVAGDTVQKADVPAATSATRTTANSTVTAPTDTAKVIRTATVDLRIARHSFGGVVARVTTISASEDGFIANADTNEAASIPSGSMTVRVPSARFNDTVGKLRALGTVERETTHGNDVTGQYTDLRARLNAATATRDAYLAILQHATNIGDVLAVQDRIQGVQTQIDQLQGQINQLDNQTTYATIALSITEPQPKAKPIVKAHKPSGISTAWDNARNGFSRRIEGLISHSGSALVIVLSLALLAVALRLLVPRARRLLV